MNLVIGSMFRDSERYTWRYFNQIGNLMLATAPGCHVTLCLHESDSVDGTANQIRDAFQRLSWRFPGRFQGYLSERPIGGPFFQSVDDPERWAQLARRGNAVLESARILADDPPPDIFMYVESDLLWTAGDVRRLCDNIMYLHLDAVAPRCMFRENGKFYDTWGHRASGTRFEPDFPYHPDLANSRDFIELDSAGSMIVMRGDIAIDERTAFAESDCIVGLCRSIREQGHRLWLNNNVEIWHPRRDE